LRFHAGFTTSSACSSAYVFTCVRIRVERLGPSVAILIDVPYSCVGFELWRR
jgi:hypothetical protein